jgi:uncharacterized Zn finger protein (UPF0148 family)
MTDYIKIPMTFKSDEKDYLDRQCPNEQCEYVFKININDWKDKIKPKNEVHCPMCGHTADSEQWYTYEQLDVIKENAQSYAANMIYEKLNQSFSKLARSTRNDKYIKITYKPSKRVTYKNNPIGQREEWNLDITCEKCGTRYSVIGSAYFCPCCGHNSVERVFEDSIERIEKMIESQDYIREKLCEQFTVDVADNMCRSMLESSLGDIVSAFQKFAKENLVQKTIQDTSKIRTNDFQIIEKGSNLYEQYLNRGYDKYLSQEELKQMNILFQKRHILEHNQGIVDKKYIQNSKDTSYEIGQRVVIKKDDTKQLLFLIKKLTAELKK